MPRVLNVEMWLFDPMEKAETSGIMELFGHIMIREPFVTYFFKQTFGTKAGFDLNAGRIAMLFKKNAA